MPKWNFTREKPNSVEPEEINNSIPQKSIKAEKIWIGVWRTYAVTMLNHFLRTLWQTQTCFRILLWVTKHKSGTFFRISNFLCMQHIKSSVGRRRQWSVNVRFDVASCQDKCPASKHNSGEITQFGTGPLGVRGCPSTHPPTRGTRVATPARRVPAWPLTF